MSSSTVTELQIFISGYYALEDLQPLQGLLRKLYIYEIDPDLVGALLSLCARCPDLNYLEAGFSHRPDLEVLTEIRETYPRLRCEFSYMDGCQYIQADSDSDCDEDDDYEED